MTRQATRAEVVALVTYFEQVDDGLTWLARASRYFASCTSVEPSVQARFIIEHPSMQDTDANRELGLRPYSTPADLLARIYRVQTTRP
jgi:hypothetical protein